MKNPKLIISFKFYLTGSIRLKIEHISSILSYHSVCKRLYTDPIGYEIETGFTFSFNNHMLTIPTYISYDKYEDDDSDLYAYYNYMSDLERYMSLKRLYNTLKGFSQSRVFQYDNQGHIEVKDNKWIVY